MAAGASLVEILIFVSAMLYVDPPASFAFGEPNLYIILDGSRVESASCRVVAAVDLRFYLVYS